VKSVVFAAAHRLAAAVRRREVSAADVVERHLDRIHGHTRGSTPM
jgi:Asp-tRNA(Asn)/Glu-tRNA(Gln) amidotransferase A subunit family amidase